MKRLLLATTSAAVLIGMSGAASAQSVLERVLQNTQNVTGIFANTADNIGTSSNQLVGRNASSTNDPTDNIVFVSNDVIADAQAAFDAIATAPVQTDFVPVTVGGTTTGYVNPLTGEEISVAAYNALPADDAARTTAANAAATAILPGAMTLATALGGTAVLADLGAIGSIDGSINVIARRLDDATANVTDDIRALEAVTTNFGNMSTTVLGAVNTGEIGLGTNQLVEEALAGSSQAIRTTVEQVGTLSDRTQIAVNSALNTMDINGSINIELDGVNASVATITPDQLDIVSGILRDEDGGILGSTGVITLSGLDQLLGSMDTTVLGAVNTGTIVSGVDNQVQGAVAGIVGNSATNMFGN